MGKKSFALFTTDVVGSMKEGPCVVPATEGSDRVEAQKRKEAQQIRLFVKLGTILALLERQEKKRERRSSDAALREQMAARKTQPLPGYPGAYSPDEMAARWAAEQAPDFEERCKKAKAAYDARNPHKKEARA